MRLNMIWIMSRRRRAWALHFMDEVDDVNIRICIIATINIMKRCHIFIDQDTECRKLCSLVMHLRNEMRRI